jgi:hypothetical protein
MVVPAPIPLENVTEQKVVDYAASRGCLFLKLNVIGRRGWPDRLFIFRGRTFFIEFKRAGEKLTKLQEIVHERIRAHGAEVYVVDSWSGGISLVYRITSEDRHLRGLL